MSFKQKMLTFVTAAALMASMSPASALADPASELEAARQQLNAYGEELAQTEERLTSLAADLNVTESEIVERQAEVDQTKEELGTAQGILAEHMRDNYRSGGISMIAILLESEDLEDFVSRVYYLDKVAESNATEISHVRDLQTSLENQLAGLEAQKTEQESVLAETQEQADAYRVRVAEAQAYYDDLDAQVQAQLAAEAAAQQAAAQAAAAEAAQNNQTPSTASTTGISNAMSAINTQPQTSSTGQTQTSATGTQATAPSQTASPEQTQTQQETTQQETTQQETTQQTQQQSAPTYTDNATRQAIINMAYSYIGVPYVWGGKSPSGFDCSGLTTYCYENCGVSVGGNRTTYALISWIQSRGNWKTSLSELQPGDMIFPHTGHVGIYLGNGMMIHAPYSGTTVKVASVYSFYGGGWAG